ncbi:MAG: phage head-tail connector protein [Firmicutes bacterium]|nr:phage head-tail connector protein [Bacillota bacterium]
MVNSAIALTTLETVKEELNINDTSKDNLLSRHINQASQFIIDQLDRDIVKTVYTNEGYTGTDTPKLTLRQYPIVSIEKIIENDVELIENKDYKLTRQGKKQGMVHRLYFNWIKYNRTFGQLSKTFQNAADLTITVDYTAGYVTPQQAIDDEAESRDLPYDIESLAIKLVAVAYSKYCTGTQGQSNYKAGSRTISWDSVINEHDMRIIDKHKRKWY